MSRKTALFVLVAVTAIILGAQTLTNGYLSLVEVSAPSTPPSGLVFVYPKSDGLLYSMDDAGTETLVSSGAGGGATPCSEFIGTRMAAMTNDGGGASTFLHFGGPSAPSALGNNGASKWTYATLVDTEYIIWEIGSPVPSCWGGSTITARAWMVANGGSGSGSLDVQFECVTSGDNPASPPGFQTAGALTYPVPGTYTRLVSQETSAAVVSACAENDYIRMKFTLNRGTVTGEDTFSLYKLELRFDE